MTAAPPMTLADFLLARIAEDEAGPWEHYRVESEYHSCPAARDPQWSGDLEVGEEFCDCGMPQKRARMLAECEAKRRIIAEHPPMFNPLDSGTYCRMCVSPTGFGTTQRTAMLGQRFPCLTLRLLALPYADAPGFREEWRP